MFVAYSRDKVYKDVGNTRQLFIDDDVVAVVKNVTRRQHTPRKHPANPIYKNDKPWEVVTYFRTSNFSVVRDPLDGLFKCWVQDFHDYFTVPGVPYERSRIYYAQSEDGLNWEKPALGLHDVDGHNTNTIIVSPDATGKSTICPNMIIDPVETDPARRFKMVHLEITNGERHGLCLSFSPDGISWTPYEGNPIIPEWIADVEILSYDPIDKKYILWGRYGGSSGGSKHPDMDSWFCPVWPSRPEGVWGVRRRIYRLESPDLFDWSKAELRWDPGEEANVDDGYYGFVRWRAGDLQLGLLNVLHQVDNTMDMYLHHSRDGLDWSRMPDHRPFIPRGDEGSYDSLGIETTSQPIEVGDEVRIYYGGMNVHHDWWILGGEEGLDVPEAHDPRLFQNGHFLGVATLRRDGWVSFGATIREGWVETKPIFSAGKHLFINGECLPDGHIKVEIMDNWNNVWEDFSLSSCETFTGDAVRHRVKWSGGDTVNQIPGAVKLRIHLRQAELYGFEFGDA